MMNKCILISIILGLFTTSCSDFLEEYSQDKIYVRTAENLEELLLGDGYMKVENSGFLNGNNFYWPYIHFMTDDTQESETWSGYFSERGFSVTEKIFGYYTYQARSGVNYTATAWIDESGDWTKLYKHINVVNNVFDAQELLSTEERASEKCKQVLGEAYFLRGAYYFILVNLYGKPYSPQTAATDPGVPLKLQGEIEDKNFNRESVARVYEQILSDLKQSEDYLSYTLDPGIIYQADSTALHLLMSRVYLYMQNWEQAAVYAQKVIDARPELLDLNGFSGGFLAKDGVETIFSMGGHMLTRNIAYAYRAFRISDDLYNAYGDDDLRKTTFMWKHGEFIGYTKLAKENEYDNCTPDRPEYYTRCYPKYWQVEVSDNFLFRTAEAYLNLAEAKAYLGEEGEANKAMEILRKKRIKEDQYKVLNLSGRALVDRIRLERRLELCMEGHRWFDLRRYAVCEKYPESKAITQTFTLYEDNFSGRKVEKRQYTLEANDVAYTLGIPQEVIEFDVDMEQNPRPERNYVLLQLN